jgi:hypothetical protein
MKELIKKILKESEEDFEWFEKPNINDVEFLEKYFRSLLRENGFDLIPEYYRGFRVFTVRDMNIDDMGNKPRYGSHGILYYVFLADEFNKTYLKGRINQHNKDFPTVDSFNWTENRQFYYDKYKEIEKIIRSIIE